MLSYRMCSLVEYSYSLVALAAPTAPSAQGKKPSSKTAGRTEPAQTSAGCCMPLLNMLRLGGAKGASDAQGDVTDVPILADAADMRKSTVAVLHDILIEEDADAIFARADTDVSGDLTLEEWIRAFGDKEGVDVHVLEALFHQFDVDNNSRVSLQEFKSAIQAQTLTKEELEVKILFDIDAKLARYHEKEKEINQRAFEVVDVAKNGAQLCREKTRCLENWCLLEEHRE